MPLPEVAKNGSSKAPSGSPDAAPSAGAILSFPGRPGLKSGYFVLDGLNICRCYQPNQEFRLETLLTLITQLLKHHVGFECHFDASGRFVALEQGSEAQQNAYLSLINRHPELFSEVPGGEPADEHRSLPGELKAVPSDQQ